MNKAAGFGPILASRVADELRRNLEKRMKGMKTVDTAGKRSWFRSFMPHGDGK